MLVVPDDVRIELKKPLGPVYRTYEKIKKLSKNHKIISVGDVCTLALLAISIRPHLAVFDFKVEREALDKQRINILTSTFRKIKKFRNKAGTLSERLLAASQKLVRNGGAVLIDGEEDLTALAFIKNADNKTAVVYGQPNEGVVVVLSNSKTKKYIHSIFRRIKRKNNELRTKQKKIGMWQKTFKEKID